MKALLTFLMLAVSASAFASGPDTVYVSDQKYTLLVFDNEVKYFTPGTNEFEGWIENNVVFMKGRKGASPSNLIICVAGDKQDEFVNKPLVFDNSKASMIDFRSKEKEEKKEVKTKTEYRQKLDIVLAEKQTINNQGIMDDNLILSLTHLKYDDKAMYMKLNLQNSSSVNYKLDMMEFVFEEPSRLWSFKQRDDKKNRVDPIEADDIKVIEAYSQEDIGVVLPLYSSGKKGSLKVTFREKTGSRTITLKVPGKVLLNGEVF